jgi:aromatic-amino-acid transaminase
VAQRTRRHARPHERSARQAGFGGRSGLDFAPFGTQNGLFSIVPLTGDQVLAMREKHAVYMAGSGRINVAGLTMGNIDKFIAAVADVTAEFASGGQRDLVPLQSRY